MDREGLAECVVLYFRNTGNKYLGYKLAWISFGTLVKLLLYQSSQETDFNMQSQTSTYLPNF